MRRKGVACLGRRCDQNLGCLDPPQEELLDAGSDRSGQCWVPRPERLVLEVQHGAMHRGHSAEGPISRSDDSHPAGARDHPLNLLFPAKSAMAGPAEQGAPSHPEGNAILLPRAAPGQGHAVPWGLGVQWGLLPPAG